MNQLRKMQVWTKSILLAKEIYKLTSLFPETERFGLISQMNRAVVSIPSNIAEGAGRESKKEFSQFISIAMGSSYELETQIIISKELGFLGESDAELNLNRVSEIQKMLVGFKKHLARKNLKSDL